MNRQPRYEPYAPSSYYADGASARPRVEGTVARGQANLDTHLYQGMVNGQPATTFPFAIGASDLERGRLEFEIHCAICHGSTGEGNGIVPSRGFTRPPSYFEPRVMNAPPGHLFDVMSNGFGAMYGQDEKISVQDRWRIAAYIRALQLSRNVNVSQLTAQEREKLNEGGRQ